jgi:hypothetical protein
MPCGIMGLWGESAGNLRTSPWGGRWRGAEGPGSENSGEKNKKPMSNGTLGLRGSNDSFVFAFSSVFLLSGSPARRDDQFVSVPTKKKGSRRREPFSSSGTSIGPKTA